MPRTKEQKMHSFRVARVLLLQELVEELEARPNTPQTHPP